MGEDGTRLAEVVDDEVSVLHRGRVGTRFREIEVELAEGADDAFLAVVIDGLRAAGAGPPDATPKVVRALGARALEPPDVAPVVLGTRPSAAEPLRASISAGAIRLLRYDPVGRKAEGLAKALANLATVLDGHRDAMVAEAWLRRAEVVGPELMQTVSELLAMQLAEAKGCGDQWRDAWKRAAAKPLRSWL